MLIIMPELKILRKMSEINGVNPLFRDIKPCISTGDYCGVPRPLEELGPFFYSISLPNGQLQWSLRLRGVDV